MASPSMNRFHFCSVIEPPVEVHSMDEVAVEHTSSPLQQTQTGRVRTPGPPTSFSLSFPLPATVRLPWNHSSLVTPCDPDIPCQVPWVYRSELVFGVEPSPISFAICIRIDADRAFNHCSMGFSHCWKALPITGFLRFFTRNSVPLLLRVAYLVQSV